mmetsp:Transcript_34378/g.73230  ORF Transcript_34378/g.73230 Transcript_34378/m.73230 type:complete len:125 (+) Transcript_34378:247-621(+)
MTGAKIPTIIRIQHSIDATATGDATGSLVGGSDGTSATTMVDGRDEEEFQEKVAITTRDLQAMKEMIREIRKDPELLYEYSPAFSQHGGRHRIAAAAAGGRINRCRIMEYVEIGIESLRVERNR